MDAILDALQADGFVDNSPFNGGFGNGFNTDLFAGLALAAIIHANPTAPSLPALLVMIERVQRGVDLYETEVLRTKKPTPA